MQCYWLRWSINIAGYCWENLRKPVKGCNLMNSNSFCDYDHVQWIMVRQHQHDICIYYPMKKEVSSTGTYYAIFIGIHTHMHIYLTTNKQCMNINGSFDKYFWNLHIYERLRIKTNNSVNVMYLTTPKFCSFLCSTWLIQDMFYARITNERI